MSGSKSGSWRVGLPRFSLRTGLILFLVLGSGLGLAARFWREIRERGEAQKWLAGRGALGRTSQRDVVFLNYMPEEERSWFVSVVRKWVHPEYDRKIQSISIGRNGLSEEGAAKITRVFDVHGIIVYGVLSEASLATVVTAPGLETLALDATVTSKGAAPDWGLIKRATSLHWITIGSDTQMRESAAIQLGRLPQLTTVTIHGRDMRVATAFAKSPRLTEFHLEGPRGPREYTSTQGEIDPVWNANLGRVLDALARLPRLKRVRLCGSELNDPAVLTSFANTSNLKILHLERDFVTPLCLAEFAKLKKIETLHLHYTPISAEHLKILSGMKSLYGLHGLLKATPQEIERLESVLPHCEVNPP